MNVYSIAFQVDDYRILLPVNPEEFDGGNLWINGSLKLASWHPPKMRWSEPENSITTPDIAYISPGFYAFNEKAMSVLGDLLADHGELLDLPVEGEAWIAFNPTTERACLNKNKSEWKVRRNGQRGRLIKMVFDEEKIENTAIFQIPELNQTDFFVTDEFVQLAVVNQLTGLSFYRNEVDIPKAL